MAGMEDILGQSSSYKYRDKYKLHQSTTITFKSIFFLNHRFKHFEYTYIRPYLIRETSAAHGHEPKILETYSKLTMKDAVQFVRRNPSGWMVENESSLVGRNPMTTAASDCNQTMTSIPTK